MIGDLLDRVVAGPDRPGHRLRVTQLGGDVELDLTEVHERAGRVATWLVDRGIGPGDLLGIHAANRLGWILLDLAALRVGAVTAGFDPAKFADPMVLPDRYGLSLLVTGVDPGPAGRPDHPRVAPMAAVEQLAAEPTTRPAPPPVVWSPDEATAWKFTSGSTGTPKAIAASRASTEATLAAIQRLFAHGPGDDLFVFLPLSLLQQRFWVYSAFAHGHDVALGTYESAFLALPRVHPTVIMGVPAFFEALRRAIETRAARDDRPGPEARRAAARQVMGPRIRYLWTGSAPAEPTTLAFFDGIGTPIFEGYGLNETCIVAKNHPGARRAGSVGQVLPGKRVEIDEDGVVLVHCDHPVAERYEIAPPGASAQMFLPGGTVRTGDLGHVDDDGFLFVHGRADDVIVLANGRKIVVRPLEERLRTDPLVEHCVVFCPDQVELVAVVSPSDPPADRDRLAAVVAAANATAEPDEIVSRVVVADPFRIEDDLLTNQFKPRRAAIGRRYHHQISDRREGIHVRH